MIYFLSSIPRSGSTLLASLLSQRKDTYVSPTSSLSDTIGAVVWDFETNRATKASQCGREDLFRTLTGITESKYLNRPESIIIDKGRTWPNPIVMKTMEKVQGEMPKIIATVRPIVECIASFYFIDKSSLSIKEWIKTSDLFTHLMESYEHLKKGYEEYPDRFCLIEYNDLVNSTQRELDRVSDFLDIDYHTFSPNISQVEENDNAWNIKDLHTLAPTIEVQSLNVRKILGDELYEYYQGGEFWNDKPEPVRSPKPIDLALEAGLRGNFTKGWEILSHEHKRNPEDNRVAFNLGWYEMMRGNLQKGHRYLDRGRVENVFGTPNIGFDKPLWNGQRNVKVLVEFEGGFGDQFYSLRHINTLVEEYGCEVIVGGYLPLAPIMRQIKGVTAIVAHEGSKYVDCDYWVPSMSLEIPLGLEFSDCSGEPYIPRLCESEGKVGVRWSGNPMFEHEQHRVFPEDLMFNTVKDEDCICLQKELEKLPEWMEQPSLETWKDTQLAISRCDLVITSCTGVAHLAGAMGVETWVVVPILPYYLWALSGNKTPHYANVTLFRQEEYGNWDAPFKEIKHRLIHRRVGKWNGYGETTKSFIEA